MAGRARADDGGRFTPRSPVFLDYFQKHRYYHLISWSSLAPRRARSGSQPRCTWGQAHELCSDRALRRPAVVTAAARCAAPPRAAPMSFPAFRCLHPKRAVALSLAHPGGGPGSNRFSGGDNPHLERPAAQATVPQRITQSQIYGLSCAIGLQMMTLGLVCLALFVLHLKSTMGLLMLAWWIFRFIYMALLVDATAA